MTTERAFMDGWRMAYCLDGGLYSPRARANEVDHWTPLLRLAPAHPAPTISSAWCHQAPGAFPAPKGHKAPHPDCVCGIYFMDRLSRFTAVGLDADIRRLRSGYLSSVNKWAREQVGAEEGPPPGLALYRVFVADPIAPHDPMALSARGGWVPDPLGTWRGSTSLVAGPILTSDLDQVSGLAERYDVEVVAMPPRDIDAAVRAMAELEPESADEPCEACDFYTGHDTSCSDFDPWWRSALPLQPQPKGG